MIHTNRTSLSKRAFFVLLVLNVALAGAVYARSNVESQQPTFCCDGETCIQGAIWECLFSSSCADNSDCEGN